MSKKQARGVQGRQWVTLTDIAHEFRVRPERIRELGFLDGCRRIPAGTIGRYELWRWEDVERAALEHVTGVTKRPTKKGKPKKRTAPASAFVPLAAS